MQISRETFDAQRRPRFGVANPERMQLAFWEWMIRGDDKPLPEEGSIFAQAGFMFRRGILKSSYGPYRARDLFQVPLNREDGPIWTFDRMGSTRTELPDGRVVCVGGEHEDFYDPDFHIYNDVVVLTPDGGIEIYGYPHTVFPPTDFHTATFVGDRILLIGCLGNPEDRRPGQTPVYALDLEKYRIVPVETTGRGPGWISSHEAVVGADGIIVVSGGNVIGERDGQQTFRLNCDDFSLDPTTCVWRRLTDRQWRQFSVHRKDNKSFAEEFWFDSKEMFLAGLAGTEIIDESDEDSSQRLFRLQGWPVLVKVGSGEIEVIIQGPVPSEAAIPFVDAIRARAEVLMQQPCVYVEM